MNSLVSCFSGVVSKVVKRLFGPLANALLLLSTLVISHAQGPQEHPADSTAALQAHLGKAYDALKQDRYEEASTELRAALAIDPKLTLKARFPLAVSLFELHQSADARRELDTVRREVGDPPNVLYYLGRLDLDDHQYESAIRNLNKAALRPPFPDTPYYLGFAYLKQGNLSLAEKWLKQASAATPRDSRVPYQLAQVYRQQGREPEFKSQLALSEKLRLLRDTDTKVKVECGQKLDQGPREEAYSVCNQLYDADNAEKLTALGTIYGQHGDLQAALKPLKRAAELAPQAPQMQYNLALTYFQLGNYEESRAALTGPAKSWPDLFPIINLFGATLLKLGDNDAAREALAHAHELNPQETNTMEMLYDATLQCARKQQAEKQYSAAVHLFQEAERLRPLEPTPHRAMSQIYAITGQSQEATAEQQTAERLSKDAAKHP
jgi:tetratricopeptide (TPR) repeat protein